MTAIALLRSVARLFSRTVLAVLLVLSMSLTVLSLTVSGVQLAVSGALSTVGVTTLAAREAAAAQTRRAARRTVTTRATQRVSRRMARGAARNSASVFAEAVPVVGVAVIAGALAYEVRDACDTARDMAGLEAAALTDGDPEDAFETASAAFDCAALIPAIEDLPDRDQIWTHMSAAPAQAWEGVSDYYEDLPAWDVATPLGWLRAVLDDAYAAVFGPEAATAQ